MRSQFRLIALTSAALATGGLVWWAVGTPPANPPPSPPQNTAKAVDPAVRSAASTTPETAQSLTDIDQATSPPVLNGRYTLAYALRMDGAGSQTEAATMTLRGTLVASVDEAPEDNGVRWIWARLEQPTLTTNAVMKTMTAFGKDSVADLSQAFAIRVLPNGRIDDVRFVETQSASARATLANIAQAAQLTANPAVSSSDVEEWSLNGPVRAQVAHARESTYAKTWTRSDRADLAGQNVEGTAQSTRGSVKFVVDVDAARIEQVTSREDGRAEVGEGNAPTYSIDVTLTRNGDGARVATGLSRDAVSPLIPELLDLKLPEEPMVSYMQALENIEDAGRVAHKRAPARRQMAQVIVNVPGTAKKVASLYAAPSTSPATRLTLLESLAGARTNEAQQAVVDLLKDDALDESLRVEVVGSIVAIPQPGELLIDSLAEIAYSDPDRIYASKVAMVLGASLSMQAEQNPESAIAHLGPYLARAAEVLTTPGAGEPARIEERTNWIGGLGNVGSPNALPLIRLALDDSREEIRAAGSHALRFQDPPTVYERMQQLMHLDDAMPVRLGVLHSAHMMGPEVTKGLVERALHYDTSENVRMEAAYVIASWMETAPGLRQMLAHALEREQSEKVRHTLRNYLEPGRVAAPAREIPTDNPLIPESYRTETP